MSESKIFAGQVAQGRGEEGKRGISPQNGKERRKARLHSQSFQAQQNPGSCSPVSHLHSALSGLQVILGVLWAARWRVQEDPLESGLENEGGRAGTQQGSSRVEFSSWLCHFRLCNLGKLLVLSGLDLPHLQKEMFSLDHS